MISTQMETARVLCVDDEESVLHALKRVFRGKRYDLEMATSARKALDLIAKHDYDLIISDMRMPNMDGAEFLHAASVFAPDTARILLTGYSEHSATERAINEGKITAYVSKPWDNAELLQTVERALMFKWHQDRHKQHNDRLKRKNQALVDQNAHLQQEVDGARQELDQSLSLSNIAKSDSEAPYQAAVNLLGNIVNQRQGCEHATYESIAELSANLGAKSDLNNTACEDLRWAGRLFLLGRFSCNDKLLAKEAGLRSGKEQAYYQAYPQRGADLLAVLEGMHGVANIVLHHRENFDGSGFPRGLKGADIPLPARILNVAIEVQRLREDDSLSPTQKQSELDALSGARFDPAIVAILRAESWETLCSPATHEVYLGVGELNAYMEVSSNLYDDSGRLVLAQGASVNATTRQFLRLLQRSQAGALRVPVRSEDADLHAHSAQFPGSGREDS